MDSYLSTQQSTIFSHVGVLIYVFEVESRSLSRDLEYYQECLAALRKYSPNAAIFLLVHKMDLVRQPKVVLERKTTELGTASGGMEITVFGTSIYDESLYKVSWTAILTMRVDADSISSGLVPNSAYSNSKRIGSNKTPRQTCRCLQRNRSYPLRTHNLPRHCHLLEFISSCTYHYKCRTSFSHLATTVSDDHQGAFSASTFLAHDIIKFRHTLLSTIDVTARRRWGST